jgi:hypothetical protein
MVDAHEANEEEERVPVNVTSTANSSESMTA